MNEDWYTFYRKDGEKISFLCTQRYLNLQTKYQHVEIIETATFGKALLLDGCMQTAILDDFVYHECIVHPALTSVKTPKSVYICGGGEGSTLREILKHPSIEQIVMVDIDEEFINIVKEYLPEWHQGSFSDPRVELIHDDARKILAERPEKFDVIIADLTTPSKDNPALMLFTREFYQLAKSKLNPGGVFATQSHTTNLNNITFTPTVHQTLRQVFSEARTCIANIASDGDCWSWTIAGDNLPVHTAADVDKILIERNIIGLKLYNGEAHIGMFALPKYLREKIDDPDVKISTDANPCWAPEVDDIN